MTILYKPALIQTKAEAEALPVGAVATRTDGPPFPEIHVARKVGPNEWVRTDEAPDPHWKDLAMADGRWVALVAVEATERSAVFHDGTEAFQPCRNEESARRIVDHGLGWRYITRYTTPWVSGD